LQHERFCCNNNIEVFSKLGDIVIENGNIYFGEGYYLYFSRYVFSFGNLEMVEFIMDKINLSTASLDYVKYLAYRIDDNVEVVDAVLTELIADKKYRPYSEMAYYAMNANNVNIFKYIYNNILVYQDPELKSFSHTKDCFIWSTFHTEFLEFFLSKSLLSVENIVRGIKIANTKDKLDIVLSYVESGRLKLNCWGLKLLEDSIKKIDFSTS
jgi:hypothetical protein